MEKKLGPQSEGRCQSRLGSVALTRRSGSWTTRSEPRFAGIEIDKPRAGCQGETSRAQGLLEPRAPGQARILVATVPVTIRHALKLLTRANSSRESLMDWASGIARLARKQSLECRQAASTATLASSR